MVDENHGCFGFFAQFKFILIGRREKKKYLGNKFNNSPTDRFADSLFRPIFDESVGLKIVRDQTSGGRN